MYNTFYDELKKYIEIAINTVDLYMIIAGIDYNDATYDFVWLDTGVYVIVQYNYQSRYYEYYDFVTRTILNAEDPGEQAQAELEIMTDAEQRVDLAEVLLEKSNLTMLSSVGQMSPTDLAV